MESLARTATRRSFQIAVDGVKLVKKQTELQRGGQVQDGHAEGANRDVFPIPDFFVTISLFRVSIEHRTTGK